MGGGYQYNVLQIMNTTFHERNDTGSFVFILLTYNKYMEVQRPGNNKIVSHAPELTITGYLTYPVTDKILRKDQTLCAMTEPNSNQSHLSYIIATPIFFDLRHYIAPGHNPYLTAISIYIYIYN